MGKPKVVAQHHSRVVSTGRATRGKPSEADMGGKIAQKADPVWVLTSKKKPKSLTLITVELART